jgi:pimeloyl-ACP methyl ester carboxylesterase
MTNEPIFGTTTSADGTELGYYQRGSGPALVITHGSVSDANQWFPATDFLAEHFTCYVFDRRGRGRSGDNPAYGLSAELDDIAAMIAVAGPGAHLLAHSYGAVCALNYVEQHGLDGGTLILFEPPLEVDGPIGGKNLPEYRAAVKAGDLDAALEIGLTKFVRIPVEAMPIFRATPLWGALVPLTPTWTREIEEIDALGDDLTPYASISTPTHLIAGTATTPFLYQSAHTLAGIIPGARITDLPDRDHVAHVVDPAGFAEAVVAALS